MPPKIQYTKEKIVDAAISIVREEGIRAVTARSLGSKLGCSSKPIFTAFKNMEELEEAVCDYAKCLFTEDLRKKYERHPSFRAVGLRWIHFAMEEPQLYLLIFSGTKDGNHFKLDEIAGLFEDFKDVLVNNIMDKFELSYDSAWKLFNQMIIHAHGIASLIISGTITFTDSDIEENYNDVVYGLVERYKS